MNTKATNEENLICPITWELMKDPVICADGFTYERAAITSWFEVHSTSPRTNVVLEDFNLIPNFALKAVIAQYLSEQQYKMKKRQVEELDDDSVEILPTIRQMPPRKVKKVRF